MGRTSTLAERAALIKQVSRLHTERRDELAKIIQREMGKPLDQALGEVDFSAAIYEYYADNAEKFLADEPIDLLGGEGSALIRRARAAARRPRPLEAARRAASTRSPISSNIPASSPASSTAASSSCRRKC